MSLDRTSESIAHFSGLFEKTLEEARLRQEYSEFKSVDKKEAEDARLEFAPVRIKSNFDIGEYDPGVRFAPKSQPFMPEARQVAPEAPAANAVDLFAKPAPPSFSESHDTGEDGFNGLQLLNIVLPFVAIPSSLVTVTLQSITLQDDDTYGNVQQAGFLPVEHFHALLASVIESAETLAPWTSDTLAENVLADPSAVHAFREQLDAVEAGSNSFATVSIASDGDVFNTHVNGTIVEEKPEFEDLLPEYIKSKREAEKHEEALKETDQLEGHSKGEPGLFEGLDHPVTSYANSGHNVISGANEAYNVVDVHTSWIDAAVFAVGGDYVNLNAVSQINVLSDHNYVDGIRQNDADAESKAFNIATVSEDAIDSDPDNSSVLPEIWNTVHYEGDITIANVVKQHTFATDNDQLQLTFTANSTAIVAGENQTFNFAHADEFGADYDLIFVGGSMISLNVVNQTNVLLDDDYFSGPGLGHAAISDGDNLLHNKAEILKKGADTQVEMMKEFKDALESLSKGAADVMEAVAKNTVFEGLESLRVLQIDGNLTQMNIIDQVNFLGDQDQVQMAKDALQSAIKDVPVSITTGSNLLSNETILETTGYDSDIMTGGDYYNDALLYQADLIDTDADPLGVSINELANEAVAFLVDDMIATSISEKLEEAGFTQDAHTGGYTFDVMQSMVT